MNLVRNVLIALLLLFMFGLNLSSQCLYLGYESFDKAINTPLNGINGGIGWSLPWDVQGGNTDIPGYQIDSSSGSINYLDLKTIGNKMSGGFNYLSMGRTFNTSNTGPFSNYVNQYGHGLGTEQGDTLYMSFLMNKLIDNDVPAYLKLHESNISWCLECLPKAIGVGYYSSNSNVGGNRKWTLKLNENEYYTSNTNITIGQDYFFVARIVFHNDSTSVNLYIDPVDMGTSQPPSTVDVSATDVGNYAFSSLGIYAGDFFSSARFDEIRLADSYECATPGPNTAIDLPPVPDFTFTPTMGQIPLVVNLDASLSSDNEGVIVSYEWNFGDGTSSTADTGVVISHTYDVLGAIPVELTVTDEYGQESSIIKEITFLSDQNDYPCQTVARSLNMASCNSNNGKLMVLANNNTFDMYDENAILKSKTNGNEYHDLASGKYYLYVEGNGNACTDSMVLQISVDSSTCAGWSANMCSMEIGTNLNALNDWETSRPLKNLFKHVRSDIVTYSNSCDCFDAYVLDEMSFDINGYPTEIPQTTSVGATFVNYILSADGGNLMQDSTYLILYDGTGTVSIFGDVTVNSATANRVVFTINSNSNIGLNIIASDVIDPVRNIRIVRLEDEFIDLDENMFYNIFLDKIAPFSVLRFMDMGSINGNPIVEWGDRRSMDYFTYAGDVGVPYEMIIELANTTKSDVWICVPHLADDDFVTQMATMFRDSLTEGQKVYLEYSNEVWNWIFPQTQYNNENKPGNLSIYRAYAEKSKRVFEIWHNVFGDDRCRVKRVLGLQLGYNAANEQIVSQLKEDEWDIAAPTYYFGLNKSNTGNPILDVSSTFQDVINNGRNFWLSNMQNIKNDYNNIHLFGKEVYTYEGGQHFVVNSEPYAQAVWDSQNSIEMASLYTEVLDTIRNLGCKLAMNFSLASKTESVHGSWGVMESIDVKPPYNVTARKYQVYIDAQTDSTCNSMNYWNGSLNSSWGASCNWTNDKIPNSTTEVVVPAAAVNNVDVDVNAKAKSVIIQDPIIMNIINGFNLDVGID